jgi:ABC-type antimicrobial peptide transport system permease subunit
VRLVVGRVSLLVGLGLLLGTIASLWATRFTSALLFGLSPRDMPTIVGAALVLSAVAAFSAWLPARRAARIDPAQVLRDG